MLPASTTLRALIDSAGDAIIATDLEGVVLAWNRAAERMYGWTEEEAIGRPIHELTVPVSAMPEAGRIMEQIRRMQPWNGRFQIRRRDESTFWADVTDTPMIDERGELVGIIGVSRDVTEQRENEERLKEALAVKDEFLGLVSHELRTPLTLILGMSRLLARRELPEHVVHDVATDLHTNAERLYHLIENMLVLARADVAEAGLIREPVRLNHLVAAVVSRHRARHPSRNITVEVLTEETLIEGQAGWIEQSLLNLLSNAEKYTPRDSSLTVTIAGDDQEVQVLVRDRGPGLRDDQMEHLFEPFYRATPGEGHVPGGRPGPRGLSPSD